MTGTGSDPVLVLSDFQNFLRTQMGNTTTVNVIISTVDYLLRLQVSGPWMVAFSGILPNTKDSYTGSEGDQDIVKTPSKEGIVRKTL